MRHSLRFAPFQEKGVKIKISHNFWFQANGALLCLRLVFKDITWTWLNLKHWDLTKFQS